MGKPLSPSDHRGGINSGTNGGAYQPKYSLDDVQPAPKSDASLAGDLVESLQYENDQLRSLCAELEQALHEATQGNPNEQVRAYDSLIEEKNEAIRELHGRLADLTAQLEDNQRERQAEGPRRPQVPLPREDELLTLSEELERERRQLQEDEQTLMEQMRQMEVSMARERAEMARQRNDLQRLLGEVRHEIERLERNGAVQSKIEGLKSRLQDATNRRGAAPSSPSAQAPATPPPPSRGSSATPPPANGPRGSIMGRLFGGNNNNNGGR
jgi:hypothetical protein